MRSYRLPRITAFVVLILLLLAPVRGEAGTRPASPTQTGPAVLLTSFAIPGSALHVAVENSSSIWFTLPAENAIGHLLLLQNGASEVVTHTLQGGSRPYDLVYGAGGIWFTEEDGNRVGRLEPANGSMIRWDLGTPGARPHGIDVLPGNPVQVWFTESGGNALGRVIYSGPDSARIDEFRLPPGLDRHEVDWSNAHPEGVVIGSSDEIWFTAPDTARPLIARFRPSRFDPLDPEYAYSPQLLRSASRPWRIKAGPTQDLWITDRGHHSLFWFAPSTLTLGFSFYTPTPNSDPQDLILMGRYLFAAEHGGGRLGQVSPLPEPEVFHEFLVPDSAPVGLAGDNATGCVWATDSAQARLLRWCPPYFNVSYLPLVLGRAP